MADNGDDHQQQPNRQQDGGGAGNLGPNNNNSNRRGARGRAPSPLWLRRDGEDGPMVLVQRTPTNVMLWDLDDPFAEEQGDDTGGGDHRDDDNDHDSVDSDDDNNVVKLTEPLEPKMAAFYLANLRDKYRRYRLRELTVSFGDDDVVDPTELPADLRRLVIELDYYDRIRELYLARMNFGCNPDDARDAGVDARGGGGGGNGGRPEGEEWGVDLSQLVGRACLEEFLGTVLGQHTSLDEITISKSRIPTRYWKLLTENLLTQASPLIHLSLEYTTLTMDDCQLLKRMLQRKARVEALSLEYCGLGADEWRTVCEGIAGSGRQVEVVTLSENDISVGPETLLPLLRAPSGVKDLHVGAPNWSEGGLEGFVKALRTNEILRAVQLEHYHQFSTMLHLVEDLLTTYNCTLETFTSFPLGDHVAQRRINALLTRNKRIRVLGTPCSGTVLHRYHVSRPSMWPCVLAEYGRLPTQLYRFVRHGNLEGFARQVEESAAAAAAAAARSALQRRKKKRKKKRRRKFSSR